MELLLRFRLHLFQPAGPIEKAVLFDLDAFWRKKTVSETGGIVACNRARGQRPDVVVIDVDRGKRSPCIARGMPSTFEMRIRAWSCGGVPLERHASRRNLPPKRTPLPMATIAASRSLGITSFFQPVSSSSQRDTRENAA